MFFFNGRIRNPNIVPVVGSAPVYRQKLGHSCIISGCLSIIIGLSLLMSGISSEEKKKTHIAMGIISASIGFFLTILVCFYAKLNICYHNWAYGHNILPLHIDETHHAAARTAAAAVNTISMGPYTESLSVTQKIQSTIPFTTTSPLTMVSDLEINKVIISRSIKIDKTNSNKDSV